MSTRQNKKRKGRTLAIPRERTVTTLTDGPDTAFLHEASGGFMTSPFASFNGFNAMAHAEHTPQMVLPPGEDDLEILEKLKEMIKNGQHEFYRAVPQPRALASLYLGPNAPAHSQPQQDEKDGPNSPVDQNRTRPPRIHNKDRSSTSNKNQSKEESDPGPTAMNVDPAPATPSEPRPLSDRLGSPDDRREHRSGPPLARNGSTASRDLDKDRERDRDRDWDGRDRDWERDRDSRVRRPPAEQRHYEPSYDRGFPPARGHGPPPSPARGPPPVSAPRSPDGPSPPPGAVQPTTMDERSRMNTRVLKTGAAVGLGK